MALEYSVVCPVGVCPARHVSELRRAEDKENKKREGSIPLSSI
jgi:hypothetical protein